MNSRKPEPGTPKPFLYDAEGEALDFDFDVPETGNRNPEPVAFMPYQSFESLDVWKRGCRLAKSVYSTMSDCKDYGLRDQMTRAAVSIPSNIAEGYERGTNKDFVRFLKISQGSAAELRTQAYIANSVELIDREAMRHIVEECKGIGAMLQALAKSRSNKLEDSGVHDAKGEDFDLDFEFPETRNPKPETDVLTEPRTPKPETDL